MIKDWKRFPPMREGSMSQPLLRLLRERVASGFYDRPEVIDAVARAIHSRAA